MHKINPLKLLIRLLIGKGGRYLFWTPQGHDSTSAGVPDGVGSQLGLSAYPFEQFHLKLNRVRRNVPREKLQRRQPTDAAGR